MHITADPIRNERSDSRRSAGSSWWIMHAVVPRLSDTPGEIKWPGGEIGQDNEKFYAGLGISCEEQRRLRAGGVI